MCQPTELIWAFLFHKFSNLTPPPHQRLKRHADAFQPSLDQLKAKYEAAMKEKMLLKLDRDKLRVKVGGLGVGEVELHFRFQNTCKYRYLSRIIEHSVFLEPKVKPCIEVTR